MNFMIKHQSDAGTIVLTDILLCLAISPILRRTSHRQLLQSAQLQILWSGLFLPSNMLWLQ